MRVKQLTGRRGSLKWIQRIVNDRRELADALILPSISEASHIEWLSPLSGDEFAEYRDYAFLQRIGRIDLADALAAFWPARGPQWDALGRTNTGEVILIEAKAHIDEMFSSGCEASKESLVQITDAFDQTISAFGAKPIIDWADSLYQLANRLAHLYFFTAHGVPACLVFMCFVGDEDMKGPESADEWRGALKVARRMLGLPKRNKFSGRMIDVFPHTSQL
jgi:hypothetical protein